MFLSFKSQLLICVSLSLCLQGCFSSLESDNTTALSTPRVVRQHSVYDYPDHFEDVFDQICVTDRPSEFFETDAFVKPVD